jgi:MerR family transcriptional regulator, copper efflux regulator
MAVYTRREIAKKTGIDFETLRFYESVGMITPSRCPQNNYRQYNEDDIEKLLFISHAKKCGFSLKEIAEILALIENQETCTQNSDEIIATKIAQIDQKIRELIKMKEMLIAYKPLLQNVSCHQIIKDSIKNLSS